MVETGSWPARWPRSELLMVGCDETKSAWCSLVTLCNQYLPHPYVGNQRAQS